jgi:hypothetical protein
MAATPLVALAGTAGEVAGPKVPPGPVMVRWLASAGTSWASNSRSRCSIPASGMAVQKNDQLHRRAERERIASAVFQHGAVAAGIDVRLAG